jgi:bacillithiol synthase
MEAACLRQTQLPHTTRLFEDFTYHFDRVERFYGHHPHHPGAAAEAASQIDYPDERRAALVHALRRHNSDSPALAQLAKPGTVAVVTGQQVGLFSGPAYTVYKALTAVGIARQLTESGVPAVPVFWLATEDHDFAEVDHAWVFGPEHKPVQLRTSGDSIQQRPVGTIRLKDIPLAGLERTLSGLPFGAEVTAEVAAAYHPDRSMGESFRELLKRLLAKYDLLYVDPLDPQIRKIGAPLLREAVRESGDLRARLLERDSELRSAGYHTQVHLEANTSLVFLLEANRRITLKAQNGSYISKDARYSAAELMDRAESLSPNALLRPVMQDYIFPTAAYVGGPAELAYLAQSEAIYEQLLGRMPAVVHRAGFTLLDQRSSKLMQRYEIGWPTVFEGEDGLHEHIATGWCRPTSKTSPDKPSKKPNGSSSATAANCASSIPHSARPWPPASARSSISFRKFNARPPARRCAAMRARKPMRNTWPDFSIPTSTSRSATTPFFRSLPSMGSI